MFVYNVKTIPVPYHINIEMVDETEMRMHILKLYQIQKW